MGDEEKKGKEMPVVVIVERRKQRESDLSSAEVMKILRKRAVKGGRKNPEGA